MRSNTSQKFTSTDKFLWFVTFAFLVSINIIGEKPIVLVGFSLLMLLFSNFKLTINKYHIFTLQFCLYCYATLFWAMNGYYTIRISKTIFFSLIALFIYYEYWKNIKDINILLKIIMWAGFVVVVYTYFYYGVEDIISSEEDGARMQNAFNNVNTIAMLTAIVLMLNYYFFLFVKKDWTIVIWLPCLFIIGATQSRKAFVMLVLGIFFLYYFKQRRNAKGDSLLPTMKIAAFTITGIFTLIILSQTSMFSGLADRMNGLIASLTGEGKEDASSYLRRIYREAAWRQFHKTPFFGCGINNSLLFLHEEYGKSTYTHCNYAELAACGGIVGLISYYSMYLYLLFKELKYIKLDSSAVLIVTWLLIRLMTDWGAVTYYTLTNYFYLMLFFIHLDNMKRKYPQVR